MAKKKLLGCSLNLIIILAIVFLALTVISFIGGSVGAMILGHEPISLFTVGTPEYHPAAEYPFPGLPITNSILASWITILVLFGLFFAATRKMKLVPSGVHRFI